MLPQIPQIGPYFRSDVNRRNVLRISVARDRRIEP